MAGVVAAAGLIGPAFFTGQQTINQVTLAFKSAAAPDIVDATTGFGNGVDFWNLSATYNGGSIGGVYLQVRIQVSPFSPVTYLSCKDSGNITIAESVNNGTSYTTIVPKTSTGAACNAASNPTADMYLYDTTLVRTVGSVAGFNYAFRHTWVGSLSAPATFPVKFVAQPWQV